MHKLLTILIVLTLFPFCATAATIRVPADQPTIQAGIDAADDGDTVLLADGTHTGDGNRDIHFDGKAITLCSENGPELCVVDADSSGSMVYNVFHLSSGETWNTVIRGFTITGGYPYGVFIEDASPRIRNCTVTNNYQGFWIIEAHLDTGTLIENALISDNTREGIVIADGGRATITNSVISNNFRGVHAYAANVTFTNCLIEGNSVGSHGGGIYAYYGYLDFDNCTIAGNTANGYGGGIFIKYCSVCMKHCLLSGNSAVTGDQYAVDDNDYYGDSHLDISYSDVFGDTYAYHASSVTEGPGMLYEDPLLVSGPEGDHYLSQTEAGQGADSPCVDAGDPDSALVHGITRTDFVLDAGVVDMGYHYPDPEESLMPDTWITGGPRNHSVVRSPVVAFIFTGSDEAYPASALTWSWRIDDEPWSDWSPQTRAIIRELVEDQWVTFEVRARDPQGDIDPTPASRYFYYEEPEVFLWRFDHMVVGPGPGPNNPPLVRTSLGQWMAYGVMSYGVNVAAGDLDGDGTDEVITGPGPGTVFGPHVRCFEPDGSIIPNAGFLAYGTNRYGVNVAAGDVDGDGNDEIITGAGPGDVFGPHVRGWNRDGGPETMPIPGISFFAYGTLKYGVNVACGDIDGDGIDEIITGAGPGEMFGAHVRGWNFDGSGTVPMSDVSWLAYFPHKWGVNVACGDLDGDGFDEIITGIGPRGNYGPLVRAWNYDNNTISLMPGIDYLAYPYGRYGVVVGAADVDQDGIDELLTLPGPGPSNSAWLIGWHVETGEPEHSEYSWNWNAFDSWLTHGGNVAGSKNGWEPSVDKEMAAGLEEAAKETR